MNAGNIIIAGVVTLGTAVLIGMNRRSRYIIKSLERNAMNIANNISTAGLNLIKRQEGLSLKVYRDVDNNWTIGRGHLIIKGDNLFPFGTRKEITQQEADALFSKDIFYKAVSPINRLVRVPLNQNQFDALCSLVFNIGEGNFAKSSLLKSLNAGDITNAANQFALYNRAGNKINSVLSSRRNIERQLFIA